MDRDLDDAADLVSLLRDRVAAHPDRDALVFLTDPDEPRDGAVRWSYRQLDSEARRCAAWLQRELPPRSRVLLLYPNGVEFAAAFLGCLYAGMIAVPVPQPGRYRHHRTRVATVAANCAAAAVLSPAAHLADTLGWAADADLPDLVVAASDAPDFGTADDWRMVPPDRSATAFLQYTSGSTGDPKGVVISHDNILHNLSVVTGTLHMPAGMRMGGWLPMYHDMGIVQLLLLPLLRGSTSIMLTPLAFIRRPVRWLRAIDQLDINMSFAPNFAYELCVRKVTDDEVAGLDLSRWQVAGNGAEPVDPAVLAAFAKKFAAAGFREESFAPSYGLAEVTVYVSGATARPPRVTQVSLERLAHGEFVEWPGHQPTCEVVSCGPPTEACEIRVVDPTTREALPDGRVGEIWLRGRSISSGYWGRTDNAELFDAGTTDGDAGYFRTGDLGALHRGEIYVHGRLKDTLIVHGRNIYPHDVEHELRAQHPELGGVGAVFAGPGADLATSNRSIVVTHEVGTGPAERLPALAAQLRRTVGREFGVQVAAVVLLRHGAVLRTTSGKVRRSAMRDAYCAGQLTALYSDQPAPAAAEPAVDSA